MHDVTLQVSQAVELINQTLDTAYPFIIVEGEVSSFKVNQGKYVFFDIKDESSSLGCFMMVFNLKFPLEDGMRVRLLAQPKLTQWGKFSLTVREATPVGEGSLKKAFELLKAKLESEGLFDASCKRRLPNLPARIGVVSSSQAAGFADFLKILDNRWGGVDIILADVAVQGLSAPAQIIAALTDLNKLANPVDVVAVIRGGGSLDDLSSFNHEAVVRAVAASRVPVISGIGHETDISLTDLAADVRAATPSNAAELLVPDKKAVAHQVEQTLKQFEQINRSLLADSHTSLQNLCQHIQRLAEQVVSGSDERLGLLTKVLQSVNPEAVLKRGYSLVQLNQQIVQSTGDVTIGDDLTITVSDGQIGAKVTNAHKKSH